MHLPNPNYVYLCLAISGKTEAARESAFFALFLMDLFPQTLQQKNNTRQFDCSGTVGT